MIEILGKHTNTPLPTLVMLILKKDDFSNYLKIPR